MKTRTILLTTPLVICAVSLLIGTLRDRDFWRTRNQRGDALLREGKYAQAARTYDDPYRVATAQYRNGDFEAAARAYARVPGAVGAFDQGNAWLMHGKYDAAIASYDRALGFRPSWSDAEENKALAMARKARLEASGKNREQEQAQAYTPDEVKFDQKGGDRKTPPAEMADQEISDAVLRATWLRQVQTTPGDFLRSKFAYQAAKRNEAPPNQPQGESK
jgi:Ca-activated chloride channel family protein